MFDNDNIYFNLALHLNATIEPGSCGLVGEARDRTVDLGEITQREMSQATAPLYRDKTINLQFKCPSYANVKVSLYAEDLLHPLNNSNILSTTSGPGYAEGGGRTTGERAR